MDRLKEYIKEQLRVLQLTNLTEYGKGSLSSIKIMSKAKVENDKDFEAHLRVLILSKKNCKSDFCKGEYETYKDCYREYLIGEGYIDDMDMY